MQQGPPAQLFLPPRVSLLFFLLVQPNIVQVEVNTPPWWCCHLWTAPNRVANSRQQCVIVDSKHTYTGIKANGQQWQSSFQSAASSPIRQESNHLAGISTNVPLEITLCHLLQTSGFCKLTPKWKQHLKKRGAILQSRTIGGADNASPKEAPDRLGWPFQSCYLPLTLTKDNLNCQWQFALDDRICLLLCLTVNTLPLSGGNTWHANTDCQYVSYPMKDLRQLVINPCIACIWLKLVFVGQPGTTLANLQKTSKVCENHTSFFKCLQSKIYAKVFNCTWLHD